MFGKHFASMYTGSMIGAGFGPYAVMGYVIANQKPDAQVGFQVELNPDLLKAIFGETLEVVTAAIEYLCAEDPKSRTPAQDGRRLIRVGQYAYQVVNGELYNKIRNEEARRAQNREAQRRFREKRKPKKTKAQVKAEWDSGSKEFEKADGDGDFKRTDEVAARGLPNQNQ